MKPKNKISCHVSDGRFFVAEIFLIDCYLKPVSIIKAQSFQYLTELLCALFFYFLISTSTSNKRFQGKEMVNLVPLVIE